MVAPAPTEGCQDWRTQVQPRDARLTQSSPHHLGMDQPLALSMENVDSSAPGASRWMVPRDEGLDSIQESVPPHPATSPPRGLTLLVEGVLLTLCSYITAVL